MPAKTLPGGELAALDTAACGEHAVRAVKVVCACRANRPCGHGTTYGTN